VRTRAKNFPGKTPNMSWKCPGILFIEVCKNHVFIYAVQSNCIKKFKLGNEEFEEWLLRLFWSKLITFNFCSCYTLPISLHICCLLRFLYLFVSCCFMLIYISIVTHNYSVLFIFILQYFTDELLRLSFLNDQITTNAISLLIWCI